jgi:hypothetical protein
VNRWTILRQANDAYDRWADSARRDSTAAREALELYRAFNSSSAHPHAKTFSAAFEAAVDARTTTRAQRVQLVEAWNYATAYATQTFFDFLHLVQTTTDRGRA